MTVCIAAIYNENSILAVSDRMVTGGYGDTTFEPPIRKIFPLTNSIAALTAGDQSIQMQVLTEVKKVINEKIAQDPEKWVDVSDAAKIYSDCYLKVINESMDRSVLKKYNLNFTSFFATQKDWNETFMKSIMDDIENFQDKISPTATLIIGVDDTGPHIYVVQGEEVNCQDKSGFAAIGIGSAHASSHFMLSSYARNATEAEALLTIHQAKRKSEVSPGVGKATDMCVVGPEKGSFKFIVQGIFPKDLVADLDTFYNEYVEHIKKLDQEQREKIQEYLNSLVKEEPALTQEIPAEASDPKTPAPQKKIAQKKNKKTKL